MEGISEVVTALECRVALDRVVVARTVAAVGVGATRLEAVDELVLVLSDLYRVFRWRLRVRCSYRHCNYKHLIFHFVSFLILIHNS